MKTTNEEILYNPVAIPKDLLPTTVPVEKILFLDIETTGLAADKSIVYLIGCACLEDGQFRLRQFFAERPEEERDILAAFMSLAASCQALFTFNGNRFDVPFLEKRLSVHGINSVLNRLESVDLYREISPYKDFLGLSNCKQTSIERMLGFERKDSYSGRDLIKVYRSYCEQHDVGSELAMMLHNADDVRGMLHCLTSLIYPACIRKLSALRVRKAQAQAYTDVSGNLRREMYLELALPYRLPVPVHANRDGCYLRITGETATLRVPLLEGELKYFYANWRDYDYLPEEDIALHRSVAAYVDNVFREKATPQNCYTRKYSQYLREWDNLFEPCFRASYHDASVYFEITDERKKSREELARYAVHVIGHIIA